MAGRVARDPTGSLALGRENLERLRSVHRRSGPWLDAWASILDDPDAVMAVVTSTDEAGVELRANGPFGGLLGNEELRDVVEADASQAGRADETGAARAPAPGRLADHRRAGTARRRLPMGLCLEPHDCVIAKLHVRRQKDLAFADALVAAGFVDPHVLLERIGRLSRATDRERERLYRWVEARGH